MEVKLSTALAIAERLDGLLVFEGDEKHHYTLVYGKTEVGSIKPLEGRSNGDLEELSEEEIPVFYNVNLRTLGNLKRREFERKY